MEKDEIKFIWGIKSSDETEEGPVNCNSLTDFEIFYRYDTKLYYYWVETIYEFYSREDEIYHLKYIYKQVTQWMHKNGYKTDYKPHFGNVFDRYPKDGFKSIEELYANFKLMCMGFVGINSKNHKKNGG